MLLLLLFCSAFFSFVFWVLELRHKMRERERSGHKNTYSVNRYNIQLKTCHMHWIVTVIWIRLKIEEKLCSLCGECVRRQAMKIIWTAIEKWKGDTEEQIEQKLGKIRSFKLVCTVFLCVACYIGLMYEFSLHMHDKRTSHTLREERGRRRKRSELCIISKLIRISIASHKEFETYTVHTHIRI